MDKINTTTISETDSTFENHFVSVKQENEVHISSLSNEVINEEFSSYDEPDEERPDDVYPVDKTKENAAKIGSGDKSNKIESPVMVGPEDNTYDITPEKSSGVLKKILKEGEGEDFPGYGDRVTIHYIGWLLSGRDPQIFDSNTKEDKFEFNLGRGMVIKGWDLGVSTMKKGEMSLFIIHPKYAYGDLGYPPTIPPHTPLLFQIQLYGWKLDDLSPKKDESILRKVLEKGKGNTAPNEGSKVKVEIIHYLGENEIFKEEKDFILGEGCLVDVPEGLEIALQRFGLKEKSLIYLKNKYVEDVKAENAITCNEIQYKVTLLHFEKAKNVWEMNSDEKFEKAKMSKEKGVDFYKMGLHKVALKQFKWIMTCLENEPGASPESQGERQALLISGYLNTALCHQKLGNHTDVIKVCSKALVLDPINEKALFRRGQAKLEIGECEDALSDFQKLYTLNPENKAARNYILLCQNKIKKQHLKDKSTYNKMFELFVKQDEERLKNMKTETGVWENDKTDKTTDQRESSTNLLDANVIEISNTANGNVYHM